MQVHVSNIDVDHELFMLRNVNENEYIHVRLVYVHVSGNVFG